MKIEKINNNQIRCILSKKDLEKRNIKINELAYGTTKVRELFNDMMQKAYIELGFVANNIPLIIEAIPIEKGDIILNISKVDDPEELDSRFSRFSPLKSHENDFAEIKAPAFSSMSVLHKLNALDDAKKEETADFPSSFYYTAYFSFDELKPIIQVAKLINPIFVGQSSLLKLDDNYILMLQRQNMDKPTFNNTCNTIADFGKQIKPSFFERLYYSKHAKPLIESDAIMQLSSLAR